MSEVYKKDEAIWNPFIMISLSFSFPAQLWCSETALRKSSIPSPTDTKMMQLRRIYGKEIERPVKKGSREGMYAFTGKDSYSYWLSGFNSRKESQGMITKVVERDRQRETGK